MVFFLDVDNTLLDCDRFVADFHTHLERELGVIEANEYWTGFNKFRAEVGYVDYLGALQQFRVKDGKKRFSNPRLLPIASFLLDYPFADLVYPRAFDAISHLTKYGTTIILSDGDVVLQPRKIQRSGLWDAVDGRVQIFVHKELMLDEIKRIYPAQRYVMIDDKPRILAAMKAILKNNIKTVFTRQGHYALDAQSVALYAPADLVIERIGDLAEIDVGKLR